MPCSDWRSGHVGNITLSCTVGVTAVVSNTCVSVDHCDAGSDDCVGPVGFESNHTCIPTGAGTHDCACLANAFGDAGPTTGCTFCPANSVSPDASTLVTDCVCAAGYGVAGDGTNQAVADGTTACDLVTCPLHSTRAADGTDTCACDIGYTVEPALDTSTNTYASISVTDASAPGFGYGAIDACSVCTLLFWKEATTSLCLPCTTCADGKFQSAACAGEGSVPQADTVCTDCAVVASAAGSDTPNDPVDDATYTCTAADNSRVSGCQTGFFKTVGQDADDTANPPVVATADTCTACSACAAGTWMSAACVSPHATWPDVQADSDKLLVVADCQRGHGLHCVHCRRGKQSQHRTNMR